MFSISAKGVYGLTAVVSLAERPEGAPVQIKSIAEEHDIPQHYLEQILVILKKAGIVESFRGARGGYALARSAAGIRVIDVLSQLEGELELSSDGQARSALGFFWQDVEQSIREKLQVSIEDLLLERERQRNSFTYSI